MTAITGGIETQKNSSSSNQFNVTNVTLGIKTLHAEMSRKLTSSQILSDAKEAIGGFFEEAAKMKKDLEKGDLNLEAIYKKVEKYYLSSQLRKLGMKPITQEKADVLSQGGISVPKTETELPDTLTQEKADVLSQGGISVPKTETELSDTLTQEKADVLSQGGISVPKTETELPDTLIQEKADVLFRGLVSVPEEETKLRNEIIALGLYNKKTQILFKDEDSKEKTIKIINYMHKNVSLLMNSIISILDIKNKKQNWLEKQLRDLNNPEKSLVSSQRKTGKRLTIEEIEKGARLAKQSHSIKQIAKELGIRETTASKYFDSGKGLTHYGERQKNNRLKNNSQRNRFSPY